MKTTRIFTMAFLVLALCPGLLQHAGAAVGDCNDASANMADTNGIRNYKINYGSFQSHFPGYGQTKVLSLIAQAADVWTSEANSGYFEFKGDTNHDWLMDVAACSIISRDYGIIIGDNDGGSALGRAWGDCCWFWGLGCEQFFVEIYPGNITDEIFLNTATHELGHAIDVGHPDNGEQAVMCGNSSNCTDNYPHTHLREWDIKCAQQEGGKRDLEDRYTIQNSDGTIVVGAWPIPGDSDIDKVGVGWNGGYNVAMITNNETAGGGWLFDMYGLVGISLLEQDSTGIEVGWWPDYNSDMDYVLYNSYFDFGGMTSSLDGHYVKYVRSENDFTSGVSMGTLKTCEFMFYSACIGDEYARSWRRASVTRFPGKPAMFFPYRPSIPILTLTAWQNANLDHGTLEDILISVGRVSDTKLPPPFSMLENSGHKSFTAPSVACSPSGTGDYQCLVAFVPRLDDALYVHVQKFNIQAVTGLYGFEYYEVVKDPAGLRCTNVRTPTDMEVWYNAGKWWMAAKSMNSGGYTYVYSSTNGEDYAWAANLSGSIVGGPSVAVDYDTGEAIIGFARY